jgi:antitoxin component YwqK of YwqJK toxin-antitoxin module
MKRVYKTLLIIITLFLLHSCRETSILENELKILGINQNDFIKIDTTFYDNQSIEKLRFVISNKEDIRISFYRSGKKKSLIPLKNSQVHGECTDWYENGNKQWIRYYDSGNQIGQNKTYSSNGIITLLVNNDTDEYIEFYPNGQPKRNTIGNNTIDDLYSNEITVEDYYYSGKIKRKYTIKSQNEYLDEYYNENGTLGFKGKIISDTTYQNGSLFTGKILTHFLNGNISHSTEVKNGLLIGKSVNYYGNGNMEYIMNFKNNEARDSIIFYHENGVMKSKENIKTGEIKKWDEFGVKQK